jgi:putative ABC transport system permease protein
MLKNYLKLALKVLLRRKVFTAISLVGISLTLVVLTVAAAMLDNIFAPRAPEVNGARTLGLYSVAQFGDESSMTMNPGYKMLDRYVRTLPGIERATIFSEFSLTALFRDGKRIDAFTRSTDGEYWKVMQYEFVEGGPFSAADDQSGTRVAVINTALRDKLFGGGRAVGRTFELDGREFRVVGVVPNVSITRFNAFSDIWVPIGSARSSAYRDQMMGGFFGLVVARSTDDFPALKNAFAARIAQMPLTDPKAFKAYGGGLDTPFENISRTFFSNRLQQSYAGRLKAIFLGLTLLFLLLPTLNLVTINLSRILERASEIGVRKAFGASSFTLIGQFIVENVVLTLIGGLIGFVLSAIVLIGLNHSGLIPYASFDLNLRIFGYGVAAALVFGLISGVWPAFRMSRLQAVDALRGGSL